MVAYSYALSSRGDCIMSKEKTNSEKINEWVEENQDRYFGFRTSKYKTPEANMDKIRDTLYQEPSVEAFLNLMLEAEEPEQVSYVENHLNNSPQWDPYRQVSYSLIRQTPKVRNPAYCLARILLLDEDPRRDGKLDKVGPILKEIPFVEVVDMGDMWGGFNHLCGVYGLKRDGYIPHVKTLDMRSRDHIRFLDAFNTMKDPRMTEYPILSNGYMGDDMRDFEVMRITGSNFNMVFSNNMNTSIEFHMKHLEIWNVANSHEEFPGSPAINGFYRELEKVTFRGDYVILKENAYMDLFHSQVSPNLEEIEIKLDKPFHMHSLVMHCDLLFRLGQSNVKRLLLPIMMIEESEDYQPMPHFSVYREHEWKGIVEEAADQGIEVICNDD